MNIWYFLMGMAMVAALFRLVERMNEFGKGYDRVPDVEAYIRVLHYFIMVI